MLPRTPSFADLLKEGSRVDATVKRTLLERMEVHARRLLDERIVLNGLKWDFIMDAGAGMALQLQAYVWKEVIENKTVTLELETPATWWEHFKQRWFPRWALARWPVKVERKTAKHTFETAALLPGFKYEAPRGCGQHVIQTYVNRVG